LALLVNDEYIADREFIEEFQRLQGETSGEQTPVELLRHTAEERVIQRTLLRQMAVHAGFSVSSEEIEAERRRRWGSSNNSICGAGIIAALEADLLIARMSAQLTRHVPRPSRVEVERFYKSNLARFYQPERVQVSHIVKNVEDSSAAAAAREVIEEAEQELIAGKSFAKVAELYSDCKGSGGGIGWIARGEMVGEFEEVVFALKKGERSPMFRSVFGWHIATVTGRKAAGTRPLEEIRMELARGIYEARRYDAITAAVADVARRSSIVPAPEDERGPVLAEEVAH
jgi:peptidyl-prolyl cis-trans isomerase C